MKKVALLAGITLLTAAFYLHALPPKKSEAPESPIKTIRFYESPNQRALFVSVKDKLGNRIGIWYNLFPELNANNSFIGRSDGIINGKGIIDRSPLEEKINGIYIPPEIKVYENYSKYNVSVEFKGENLHDIIAEYSISITPDFSNAGLYKGTLDSYWVDGKFVPVIKKVWF